MSKEVPGKATIAYLSNRSDLFVTDFTPKLYSNDMATNCQAVNLSSADNSSQFSSGQTMLQGVPISMDVVIVLHSLRAGGIMGITPVRSNRSALSFVVEPVVLLLSCIVGYVLSALFSCLVSTELVSYLCHFLC